MFDRNSSRRNVAAFVVFVLVYLLVISLTTSSYYQGVLALVAIWAVMGLSWNVLSGYTGLVSFGHAAFFGIGAYTVAILFAQFRIPPMFSLPIAAVLAAIAGVVIGSITFRLRGHYFSLAMLAFPLSFMYLFEWAGYQELSLPMVRDGSAMYLQFQNQQWSAVAALVLLVIAMAVTMVVEKSRFGLSLLSIKQNEIAAEAAGINSYAWKLKAVALSGALAGVAGGLYATILLVVTPPSVFGLTVSAQALVVAMFGGVGTVWGPLLGAVILIPLGEILNGELGSVLPGIQGVVFGIAIILISLLMPQGAFWFCRDLLMKRGEADSSPSSPAIDAARSTPQATTAIGATLLEVQNVSQHFGGVQALNDVSFAIREREILGIIGPNGAGKTTLFNVVNGIFPPSFGKVVFENTDIASKRSHEICALGIARTFQVVRSFPRMTLLQNVVVGAFVHAKTNNLAEQSAREALAAVGLLQIANAPAKNLSNYQLRLMEMARALASRPKLLLLDEPFAGLSSTEIDKFVVIVKAVRASGVTIAIIEHTMQAMLQLADRLLVLDQGAVLVEGAPREVIRDKRVISAYLGSDWTEDARS